MLSKNIIIGIKNHLRRLSNMTLEELEFYLVTCTDEKNIKVISCLIEAWNDWPKETKQINEYLNSIREYLGTNEISHLELLKRLEVMDVLSEAWYAESLASLEKIYSFESSSETIEEIVSQFKQR